MSVSVALTKPVQAHGDEVAVLELRKPTGKDIRVCGMPYRIEAGAVVIDAAACAKLIAGLAAVPPSTVDALAASDWTACVNAIMGFLAPPTAMAAAS